MSEHTDPYQAIADSLVMATVRVDELPHMERADRHAAMVDALAGSLVMFGELKASGTDPLRTHAGLWLWRMREMLKQAIALWGHPDFDAYDTDAPGFRAVQKCAAQVRRMARRVVAT